MDDWDSMWDDGIDGSGLGDATEVGAAANDDTDSLLSPLQPMPPCLTHPPGM